METIPPPHHTRFFLAMLVDLILKTRISYDRAFKTIIRRYGYRGWLARLFYKMGYYYVNYYYGLRYLSAKNGYGLKPAGVASYYASIGFSYKRALRILRSEVKGLSRTKRIALLYGYPEYVVEDLLRYMDEQRLELMLRALNSRKRWLRINLLRGDAGEAVKCLEEEGVIFSKPREQDYMLFVEHPKWSPVSKISCVREGLVVPQDYSSSLVVEALAAEKGGLLDACSAPGLKLSLAHMLSRKIYSVGIDVSRKRISSEANLLVFLGVDPGRNSLFLADSGTISLHRVFDYALIDAPCSGLGSVYSDPAVKLNADRRSKLEHYHEVQYGILKNISRYAERIVYATCSIHPLEGELVVKKAVEEGLLEPVEPPVKLSPGYGVKGLKKGSYRVYPDESRSQGFYISVLESRVAGK